MLAAAQVMGAPSWPHTTPPRVQAVEVQAVEAFGRPHARPSKAHEAPSLQEPSVRRSPHIASREQLMKSVGSPQAASSNTRLRRLRGAAEERRPDAGSAGHWLIEVEDKLAAVRVRLAQTLDLRDRQLEDLKQVQEHRLEATTALERLERDLHFSAEHSERAEEHSSWLVDLIAHCNKAEAKKVFEGPVAEALGQATAKLREAGDLQRSQVKEATASHRRGTVAREAAAQNLEERDAGLAEAQSSLARFEEDAQAAQTYIERYSKQLKHLHAVAQAEQEAIRLRREAERAEEVAREAGAKKDETRQQMAEHRAWTEDLKLFFKGDRPRDSNAILRGLQGLCPSGDALPVVVRAMLSEKRLDVTSSTVRSVNGMVDEHLRRAEAALRENLRKVEATFQESDHQHVEVSQKLHQQDAHVKAMLSQAGGRAVAAPLRTGGSTQVPHRSSSGSGATRAAFPASADAAGAVRGSLASPTEGSKNRRPNSGSWLSGSASEWQTRSR